MWIPSWQWMLVENNDIRRYSGMEALIWSCNIFYCFSLVAVWWMNYYQRTSHIVMGIYAFFCFYQINHKGNFLVQTCNVLQKTEMRTYLRPKVIKPAWTINLVRWTWLFIYADVWWTVSLLRICVRRQNPDQGEFFSYLIADALGDVHV